MPYSNLGRKGFIMLWSIVHHKGKLGQKLEVGTEAETGKKTKKIAYWLALWLTLLFWGGGWLGSFFF